jgi:hypothetical protein
MDDALGMIGVFFERYRPSNVLSAYWERPSWRHVTGSRLKEPRKRSTDLIRPDHCPDAAAAAMFATISLSCGCPHRLSTES